jgi:hypothetical protein
VGERVGMEDDAGAALDVLGRGRTGMPIPHTSTSAGQVFERYGADLTESRDNQITALNAG